MAEIGWPLIPREVLPAPVPPPPVPPAAKGGRRPSAVPPDAGRQLSIFGAESTEPSPADLAGLLAGPGRLDRMGGTARISVPVDAAWRVHVLVAELVSRGLVVTWHSVQDPAGVRQAPAADVPPSAPREQPVTSRPEALTEGDFYLDLAPDDEVGGPPIGSGAREAEDATTTATSETDVAASGDSAGRVAATAGRIIGAARGGDVAAARGDPAAGEAGDAARVGAGGSPGAGLADGAGAAAEGAEGVGGAKAARGLVNRGPTGDGVSAGGVAGTGDAGRGPDFGAADVAATTPGGADAAPGDGDAAPGDGDAAPGERGGEPAVLFEVRTAYSSRLNGLARAWPAAADQLFLSGPRLRLWVAAAGRPQAGGYALGLDPAEPVEAVDAALRRAGLEGVVSDHGLHYLITGRRRLQRLAELVGDRPAAAPEGLWPDGAGA